MPRFTKEKLAEMHATVLLGQSDQRFPNLTTDALIKLGKPVVPFLIKELYDKKNRRYIREIAAIALGKIGDISALPALISFHQEHGLSVPEGHAEIIAMGKGAIPALLEAIKDPNGRMILLHMLVSLDAGTDAICLLRKLSIRSPEKRAELSEDISIALGWMIRERKLSGSPQLNIDLGKLELKRFPPRPAPVSRSMANNIKPAKMPQVALHG